MQTATVAVTRRAIKCDECPTPVAEVREQGIVIKSKHYQATHVTILTWGKIRALLAEHDNGELAA